MLLTWSITTAATIMIVTACAALLRQMQFRQVKRQQDALRRALRANE